MWTGLGREQNDNALAEDTDALEHMCSRVQHIHVDHACPMHRSANMASADVASVAPELVNKVRERLECS